MSDDVLARRELVPQLLRERNQPVLGAAVLSIDSSEVLQEDERNGIHVNIFEQTS